MWWICKILAHSELTYSNPLLAVSKSGQQDSPQPQLVHREKKGRNRVLRNRRKYVKELSPKDQRGGQHKETLPILSAPCHPHVFMNRGGAGGNSFWAPAVWSIWQLCWTQWAKVLGTPLGSSYCKWGKCWGWVSTQDYTNSKGTLGTNPLWHHTFRLCSADSYHTMCGRIDGIPGIVSFTTSLRT